MKKIMALCLLSCTFLSLCAAQSILTAPSFFQTVSAEYAKIQDYEASVDIQASKTSMEGKVSFKRPNLLRIDFSNPEEQVITFNGDTLTIYLPGSDAVLEQAVDGSESPAGSGANLATPQGLSLMSRYYSVAYEVGQDPIPLEDGSDEMVVRLVLSRRNTSEAFRFIKLSVIPSSKLIRRIEAVTPQGETFCFNFTNYAINKGITDQRFLYDPPSSANYYNNFLFSE
ncbi:MAG: outer membrane lipoprotein carrier protein LolA [Treponema sp.]|nr:outer membrane lipoprotein carrier protein LolA [Treponema sp.]MBR4464879.1 outer membrane lipoprotein carrier protein LolA [Treponema sp.]